jgi:RNase adaptor protein for sRNA GlmZ degradation
MASSSTTVSGIETFNSETNNRTTRTLVLTSFGYEKGVPQHDQLHNVKDLPYSSKLVIDNLTGLDRGFQTEFLSIGIVIDRIEIIKQYALTHYNNFIKRIEPKDGVHDFYFTVAIGCKNGRHRSVAIVEELSKILIEHMPDCEIIVQHPHLASKKRGDEKTKRNKERDQKKDGSRWIS